MKTPSSQNATRSRNAAKRYARGVGHYGKPGGWLYAAPGSPICQGWSAYEYLMADRILASEEDYARQYNAGFDSARVVK